MVIPYDVLCHKRDTAEDKIQENRPEVSKMKNHENANENLRCFGVARLAGGTSCVEQFKSLSKVAKTIVSSLCDSRSYPLYISMTLFCRSALSSSHTSPSLTRGCDGMVPYSMNSPASDMVGQSCV